MTSQSSHTPTRHYLSKLTEDELRKFLEYPSELHNELYDMVAENNGYYSQELAIEILGKDYGKFTKYDSTLYDWWLHIQAGCYAHTLDIEEFDYFSEDDATAVKQKQKDIRALMQLMDELDTDSDDYWDTLGVLADKADEIADEIIQIVVHMLKETEEVTDRQILDTFLINEMGDDYYYEDDDRTYVYMDTRKAYNTHIKDDTTNKGE